MELCGIGRNKLATIGLEAVLKVKSVLFSYTLTKSLASKSEIKLAKNRYCKIFSFKFLK